MKRSFRFLLLPILFASAGCPTTDNNVGSLGNDSGAADAIGPDGTSVAKDAAQTSPEVGAAHECRLNPDGTCLPVTPNTGCTPFTGRRYDESAGCNVTVSTTLGCCATAAGSSCGWPEAIGCYQVASAGGTVAYWTPALVIAPLPGVQACDQSESAKVRLAPSCASAPADAAVVPDASSGAEAGGPGSPCDLTNLGSAQAVYSNQALECTSRICLKSADEVGGVNTGAFCSSECSADSDCVGQTRDPSNPTDTRCAGGYACVVAFVVGPLACKKLCLCKDFLAGPPSTPVTCSSTPADAAVPDAASVGKDAAPDSPEAGAAHQCQLNADGTCSAVTPDTACTPYRGRRYNESAGCLAANLTTLWCCATAAGNSCAWPATTGCLQVSTDAGAVTYGTPSAALPSMFPGAQACDQNMSGKVASAWGSLCPATPADAAVPTDATPVLMTPTLPAACTTDGDCCMAMDGCMATAYLVGQAEYSSMVASIANVNSSRDAATCLRCTPPSIQVQCKSGFCVGEKISSYSSGIVKSHCGYLALPDAGAAPAVSPYALVDSGSGSGSSPSAWGCGP